MISTAKDRLRLFEKNIAGDDFLSRKMRCEYACQKDVNMNIFYTGENFALMVMGANISVRGTPSREEREEIASFCSFMGISAIESRQADFDRLYTDVMYLMEYSGGAKNVKAPDSRVSLYAFSAFCCENFPDSYFDTVYSYFARKVNKGFSKVYCYTYGDKIVSGALATDYGDCVYITFVSTAKEHRGSGYAGQIVEYIAAGSGKKAVLMCEGHLKSYYEKLGFKQEKEIYLHKMRKLKR